MSSQRALLLGCLAATCLRAAAVQELSNWYSGILTHYGGKQDSMDPTSPSFGTKEGSCGYGLLPRDRWPYWSVAALSQSNPFFKNSTVEGCGMCFQIQCVTGMDDYHKDVCLTDTKGVRKSILVMITDKCPQCDTDHIDVQALTFAKMTNPDLGRIKINYRRIECTPPEDMKVSVMDFIGAGKWIRLAVDVSRDRQQLALLPLERDTGGRGAVTQVSVKSSGSSNWTPMVNKWGAAWELGQSPSPPLDFKFQCDSGEDVVATGVIKQNGGINQGAFAPRLRFDTGVQFTINDPAAQLVKATAGPDDGTNLDPMVATSDTPGNSGLLDGLAGPASTTNGTRASGNAAAATVAAGTCVDASGNCGSPGLAGYCNYTCGKCGSGLVAPTATTTTPSASPGGATTTAGAAGSCVDVPLPGGIFTCSMQKEWNRCNVDYMLQGNYCAATCGRCSGAPAPTSGSPSPMAPATPTPAAVASSSPMPASPSPPPPPPSPSPASVASSPKPSAPVAPPASENCADVVPPGVYTCAQQKAWGKCSDAFINRGNYCQATCGTCKAAPPPVQAFSGPSPQSAGGRRRLLGA
ncbi:hypothetical protein N2152v2_006954 [Parachlorella kessleri]